MLPIVVSYPRTGSKIVTDIVYNYSKQYFSSEGCLQEFLLPGWYRQDNFKFQNHKIVGQYVDLPKELWHTIHNHRPINEILDERISWLENNPNYVFKLMVNPRVPNTVYKYCLDTFDCIFLERKDTVRSFLSFLFLSETKHHHEVGSNTLEKAKTKIRFYEMLAETWVWDYNTFNQLKSQSKKSKSIIYEDLLDNNQVSESILLQKLGWKTTNDFVPCKFQTIATPYADSNLLDYFTNPNEVISFMKKHNSIFKSLEI